MRATNIITINGRPYDAITGMPFKTGMTTAAVPTPKPSMPAAAVKRPASAHLHGNVMSDVGPRPVHHAPNATAKPAHTAQHSQAVTRQPHPGAHHIHQQTQRSQTLHRGSLTRPTGPRTAAQHTAPVQKSTMIHKFAPSAHHLATAPHHSVSQKPTASHAEKLPQPSTAHTVAMAASHHAEKAAVLQGKDLKEHLIKERLRHIDTTEAGQEKPDRLERLKSRRPRAATIFSSIAALVLLGGYMTYLSFPGLSIRVAATQAGVEASYPSYQPAGYSFAGPVAFSPGEVRINFASNTNDYKYSLVQRASSWDSQAVLDNYVTKETAQYATLQERGLTIYLMENKAAWVNGGVLHIIDGNAPLSSEQIQKIASSTL